MATMNILSASVQGKLGVVYGVKQKKAHVLKAIPFSHSPHNETQTKCVRAFEKLNRLSGGIAKIAFPYLNLSDKKVLKHNAVATWLKPLIEDKTFQPSKLADIIEPSDETKINTFEVDYEKNIITVSAETTEEVSEEEGKKWFFLVFDDFGYIFARTSPQEKTHEATIRTKIIEGRKYYAMAFRSDKTEHGYNIHALSMAMS